MSRAGDWYHRFDRYQQRHAWLGFPLAVRQKYSEDQGGYLAATITYYGFFSIFPLLLVLRRCSGSRCAGTRVWRRASSTRRSRGSRSSARTSSSITCGRVVSGSPW